MSALRLASREAPVARIAIGMVSSSSGVPCRRMPNQARPVPAAMNGGALLPPQVVLAYQSKQRRCAA